MQRTQYTRPAGTNQNYVSIYRRCRLTLCEIATLAVLTAKWNGLHPIRISNRRSSYAKITK